MRRLISGMVLMFFTLHAGMAQEKDAQTAGTSQKPVPNAGPVGKPAPDTGYRVAQVAFVCAAAADLGTTVHAQDGYAEGNPLLGKSKAQQIGVSVGLGALTLWGAWKLKDQGHTKAAKLCLWLGTALHSSGALYNATRQPKTPN
jgi:hypothetical protein